MLAAHVVKLGGNNRRFTRMRLTQQEVSSKLQSAGVPGWLFASGIVNQFKLADPYFETGSKDWVMEAFHDWVFSLPSELVTVRHLGGGKSIAIPKWVKGAGDCENHSIVFAGHCMVGNWKKAVREGDRGGICFGIMFYKAEPKPGNSRDGGHCICWLITHEGEVAFFEPGDGDFVELTKTELDSIWFGLAA